MVSLLEEVVLKLGVVEVDGVECAPDHQGLAYPITKHSSKSTAESGVDQIN